MRDEIQISEGVHILIKDKDGRIKDASWFGDLAATTEEQFMQDDMKITGKVHILIKDKDGRIKVDCWHGNLVVTTGRNHIADQMADAGEAAMSHMAIGTGTNAVLASDTALQTELSRKSLTSKTQGTGDPGARQVTYIADWPAGEGTGAITEAGVFNSASAGTMLCRSVFPVKNKGVSDSLTMTWVVTFSA